MVLPPVATDELARRIHVVYPGGPLDVQLDHTVDTAVELLAGHVDDTRAGLYPNAWVEAVTQLAVKIWDTSARGLAGMDAVGEFTYPAPAATPQMVTSVFGVLAPCMTTGGNVVA